MVEQPRAGAGARHSGARLAAGTFVIGTCLAGLGGVMIAPLVPVQPFMGLDYVLCAFFVLVVGGLGSVAGLLSGAAVIGGVDSVDLGARPTPPMATSPCSCSRSCSCG